MDNKITNLIFQLEEFCRLDPSWNDELRKINKIYEKYGDISYLEIAVIMITKFPDIEELFYTNFDKMIEKYGEKTDILIKCLDIIWTEGRV